MTKLIETPYRDTGTLINVNFSPSGMDSGWAVGLDFFIQASLFSRTGSADWEIEKREGERHNYTNGEIDYQVRARRIERSTYPPGMLEPSEVTYSVFPGFRLNANIYSWEDVLKRCLESVDKVLQRT